MEVDVAGVEELTDDRPIMKRAKGRLMVLLRAGEEVFAVGSTCPHWGAPMRDGKISVQRGEIECPWHRFRFDLRTGACVAAPSGRRPLPVYPARVVDGRILVTVETSSEARADAQG